MLSKALHKQKPKPTIIMRPHISCTLMAYPRSAYQCPQKSPKHGNFVAQLCKLSQNVEGKRCLEHLLTCHHPPGWTLVTEPRAARYPAICHKAESWMLNNPPGLIFLTLWKQFSRPSLWECHLPNGKQITAASSSSRRTQLSFTFLCINNLQQWWHGKNVFYSKL